MDIKRRALILVLGSILLTESSQGSASLAVMAIPSVRAAILGGGIVGIYVIKIAAKRCIVYGKQLLIKKRCAVATEVRVTTALRQKPDSYEINQNTKIIDLKDMIQVGEDLPIAEIGLRCNGVVFEDGELVRAVMVRCITDTLEFFRKPAASIV